MRGPFAIWRTSRAEVPAFQSGVNESAAPTRWAAVGGLPAAPGTPRRSARPPAPRPSASLLVRPQPHPSSVRPSAPADSLLAPERVAHELLQGLVAHDAVTPRVSLATVRALRRAEQSHVERVTAAVQACLEHERRTGTRERDRHVLEDLAPFERRAVERLLARSDAQSASGTARPDALQPVRGEPHGAPATPHRLNATVRRRKRRLP